MNSYSATLLCSLLGFNLLAVILSSSVDSRDFDYQQRSVILPLFISPTNSSHRRVLDRDHRLRHLQNLVKPHSSNARMRLHDDLLTNGSVLQKFSTLRFCFRIVYMFIENWRFWAFIFVGITRLVYGLGLLHKNLLLLWIPEVL